MSARREYVVRWRRDGSNRHSDHFRLYQSEAAARRFANKLLHGEYGNQWSPIISLRIESRPVGTWEHVREWLL